MTGYRTTDFHAREEDIQKLTGTAEFRWPRNPDFRRQPCETKRNTSARLIDFGMYCQVEDQRITIKRTHPPAKDCIMSMPTMLHLTRKHFQQDTEELDGRMPEIFHQQDGYRDRKNLTHKSLDSPAGEQNVFLKSLNTSTRILYIETEGPYTEMFTTGTFKAKQIASPRDYGYK
ncbi:hypothetical protein TNCT_170191 [Trichonephila clavata]|uniref:Uncharacterized protein n=1 Tax=Trichonephila clavata TaxID=2740835 RepID=A0A8X6HFX3_TRICU|nr:hypothetical protein TNCT_170191 [Trichonephila clavata]